jgi:hypothetical protein
MANMDVGPETSSQGSGNQRASESGGGQESDSQSSNLMTAAEHAASAAGSARHGTNVSTLADEAAAVHTFNDTAVAVLQRVCLLLVRQNSVLEARLRRFQVRRLRKVTQKRQRDFALF